MPGHEQSWISTDYTFRLFFHSPWQWIVSNKFRLIRSHLLEMTQEISRNITLFRKLVRFPNQSIITSITCLYKNGSSVVRDQTHSQNTIQCYSRIGWQFHILKKRLESWYFLHKSQQSRLHGKINANPCRVLCPWDLTHWGRDKMDATSQTTFSSAFSWMKMYEFRLKFHWILFLRVQLTIFQNWLR